VKIASIAEIKAHLSAYLKESAKGPIIVTKNGKPVAVLLGITDEEEIERLVLAYSPKFQAVLARGRRQIQESGGIAHKDFWQETEAKTSILKPLDSDRQPSVKSPARAKKSSPGGRKQRS